MHAGTVSSNIVLWLQRHWTLGRYIQGFVEAGWVRFVRTIARFYRVFLETLYLKPAVLRSPFIRMTVVEYSRVTNKCHCGRHEGFVEVLLRVWVSRDVMLCLRTSSFWRFDRFSRTAWIWIWSYYDFFKRREIVVQRHSSTYQKTWIRNFLIFLKYKFINNCFLPKLC